MKKTDDSSQRFYDYLPERPRWGFKKELYLITRKEDIIGTANYIQLPTQKRGYIVLDLDYDMALFAWNDEYLPEPTIIIINKSNGHAQYLYELENPVILPLKNSKLKTSRSAVKFYNAVSFGYKIKLKADIGHTGYAIKNPFSPMWDVFWKNHVYDLQYLSEFVKTPPLWQAKNTENYCGRHMDLFHNCRKSAYKLVKNTNNYEIFYEAVKNLCFNYAETYLWYDNLNNDFTNKEVLSIAQSISKWTWNHRDDGQFGSHAINPGIMDLKTIRQDSSLSKQDETKLRQKLGAKYANLTKRENTVDKINYTINNLNKNNKEITIDNIIRFSNLSKSTIYNYKDYIENIINKDKL